MSPFLATLTPWRRRAHNRGVVPTTTTTEQQPTHNDIHKTVNDMLLSSCDNKSTSKPIAILTTISNSTEEDITTSESCSDESLAGTIVRNSSNNYDSNSYSHHENPTKAIPVTPDGFKPRKSSNDIRRDWIAARSNTIPQMQSHVPQQIDNSSHHNTKPMLKDDTQESYTNRAPVVNDYVHENNMIVANAAKQTVSCHESTYHPIDGYGQGPIPNPKNASLTVQLPPLPSRSWSTEGGGMKTPATQSLSQDGSSCFRRSKTSSTGRVSFCSSSSTMNLTPLAESPHLEPGRALTAVGNLVVSMQQQQQQMDPPGATPMQNVSHHYYDNYMQSQHKYDSHRMEKRTGVVDTMVSPMFHRLEQQPLLLMNDNHLDNRSMNSHKSDTWSNPRNMVTTTTTRLPMISEQSYANNNKYVLSTQHHLREIAIGGGQQAISNRNNMIPAPSKRSMQDMSSSLLQQQEPPIAKANLSQSIVEQKQNGGYNWTVTTTPSSSSNSNSTGSKASKRTITSSSNSIVAIDSDHILRSECKIGMYKTHPTVPGSTSSLLQRKVKSQVRVKEELIISALERLQDNLQLVFDVDQLLQLGSTIGCSNQTSTKTNSSILLLSKTYPPQQQQSMYDWFLSTPIDEEGLLTGFTDTSRYAILDKIDLLLHECTDTDTTDSTTGRPSSMVPTLSSLREALVFCSILVKMAISESEKEDSSLQGTEEVGQWKFASGLREAIGLPAQEGIVTTPYADRGGDASFFSLPDDENDNCDTPMTSNVSIGASTLTTIQKDRSAAFGTSAIQQHAAFGTSLALKQQKQYNGLYLRQAIQLYTTGIQKMSVACHDLCQLKGETLNPNNLFLVAHHIHDAYQQLLSMGQSDLKSIVDAFEFDICANSYEDEQICELVDDEEDHDKEESLERPVQNTNNTQESPILFAETLGFGVLNSSITYNDTSFDASYDNSSGGNHVFHSFDNNSQESAIQTPHVNSIITSTDMNESNRAVVVGSIPANHTLQQELENIDRKHQHRDVRNAQGTSYNNNGGSAYYFDGNNKNNDDDENQSLVSFTPSYQSIRFEI